MSRNLNPFREMRLSSILTILACLSLCGFSVYRAMDGQPILMTSAVIASEANGIQQPGDALSSKIFGPESPILTKAAPAYSTVRLTPIEELQVGDRVRADSPTSDLDLEFGPEVVSERWRKLSLLAPKRDGTTADVVLLRPLFWLNEQKAEVGGTVYISVPECGIDGHAKVLSIEPCPEIVPGEGRVITGTFRHQATSGISLSVTGQSDPIRCTGNHPVWSEMHEKFVRADSLQIGESLRTATGIAHVRDISLLPGLTPVFNLEIHGLHVYHVGTAGVLVHNGDPCADAEALFNPALRTKTNAPKRVTNPKHHPNSLSPEPKNVQHLFDNSIVDKKGVRWAKDADGTIHRFGAPSNGETHWNGSTGGNKTIRWDDIPIEIRRLLQ